MGTEHTKEHLTLILASIEVCANLCVSNTIPQDREDFGCVVLRVLGSRAVGSGAALCITGGRGSDLKKLRGHDEESSLWLQTRT